MEPQSHKPRPRKIVTNPYKNKESDDEFMTSFRRGTQLLHQNQPQEALPYLERAYQLDPQHVDAGINLSGAYILTQQFRKAVAVLEPLSQQVPQHVMVWINLGAAYLGNPILARDEQQLPAIAAFEKALALNPAAPSVAYNLGLIYRDRQEREQAIYWFRRALQANPQDRDAQMLLRRLTAENEEAEDGQKGGS